MGAPQSDEQNRVHGEKGTRLDEYRDDGLVQPTASSPHSSANAPGVEDEPSDDHEGEEGVERKRN